MQWITYVQFLRVHDECFSCSLTCVYDLAICYLTAFNFIIRCINSWRDWHHYCLKRSGSSNLITRAIQIQLLWEETPSKCKWSLMTEPVMSVLSVNTQQLTKERWVCAILSLITDACRKQERCCIYWMFQWDIIQFMHTLGVVGRRVMKMMMMMMSFVMVLCCVGLINLRMSVITVHICEDITELFPYLTMSSSSD